MRTPLHAFSRSTILNKTHSYQTEEFGTISEGIVTKICEDKYGATYFAISLISRVVILGLNHNT